MQGNDKKNLDEEAKTEAEAKKKVDSNAKKVLPTSCSTCPIHTYALRSF